MAASRPFTVSGGAVDRKFPAGGDVALSAAINLAQRHRTTMYVRTPDGSPFGRVEFDAGRVAIYKEQA